MKYFLHMIVILLFWAVSVSGNDVSSSSPISKDFKYFALPDADQPDYKVEIYPNPVTEGRLTINTTNNIQSVQILNITGKIVFNQEYQPNTSSVNIELDKMEKGIYLVRINFSTKENHTEKIMIK
jgi:hypothetical protein